MMPYASKKFKGTMQHGMSSDNFGNVEASPIKIFLYVIITSTPTLYENDTLVPARPGAGYGRALIDSAFLFAGSQAVTHDTEKQHTTTKANAESFVNRK